MDARGIRATRECATRIDRSIDDDDDDDVASDREKRGTRDDDACDSCDRPGRRDVGDADADDRFERCLGFRSVLMRADRRGWIRDRKKRG